MRVSWRPPLPPSNAADGAVSAAVASAVAGGAAGRPGAISPTLARQRRQDAEAVQRAFEGGIAGSRAPLVAKYGLPRVSVAAAVQTDTATDSAALAHLLRLCASVQGLAREDV